MTRLTLRDVRVPDLLHGREREALRVAVRKAGRVNAIRMNRPGLALERDRPRSTRESEVVVQPVTALGEHLATTFFDDLRDDLGLRRGAGRVVRRNPGGGVHCVDQV